MAYSMSLSHIKNDCLKSDLNVTQRLYDMYIFFVYFFII